MSPRISILMSVYNERPEWLRNAVESIFAQTFTDWEFVIIVDNPELPPEQLDYLRQLGEGDRRVVVHRNDYNIGLARSLNVGISLTRGEYIARMDADDIARPNRLEKEVCALEDGGFDMVSSYRELIDEDGSSLGEQRTALHDPAKHLPYSNFIVHSSIIAKAEAFRELGGYRCFPVSEDYDMWLRFLSSGYSIGIVEEPLILYRVRTNSMTQKNVLLSYYVSEYQRKLYRERVRTGVDHYSESELKRLLASKDMSEGANSRYSKAERVFGDALEQVKQGKASAVLTMASAIRAFPSVTLSRIAKVIRMRLS